VIFIKEVEFVYDFGLRLRELRERHKLSQEQLGRKINRSKSVVSSYENNLKMPSVDILTSLAVLYNVSLDYLVGIDKNQMVSIEGLTNEQKNVIHTLLLEFKDKTIVSEGLTPRQQDILNILMKEFSKRK